MKNVIIKCACACVLMSVAFDAWAYRSRFSVLILDAQTGEAVPDAKVRAAFSNMPRSMYDKVKSTYQGAVTDEKGSCSFKGKTNCGEASFRVDRDGYYFTQLRVPVSGVADGSDILLPDHQVVTGLLYKVGKAAPKIIGTGREKEEIDDIFVLGDNRLAYDMVACSYLPPIGTGVVADVEFVRLPREDLGPASNECVLAGRSYVDKMLIRFPGEGNGIVKVKAREGCQLPVAEAPEDGYQTEIASESRVDERLRCVESWGDKSDWYCFRIRSRRDEDGRLVEGLYGKFRRSVGFSGIWPRNKDAIHQIGRPEFYYCVNPENLDRSLECAKQNLGTETRGWF